MSEQIQADLVGGLIGLALTIPLIMILQPLVYHGENPLRFWVWLFGHWTNRPRLIQWGRSGRFGVHERD